MDQGQSGLKYKNQSKRKGLKSASADLGTVDVVRERVLEVVVLPESHLYRDKLLTPLALSGPRMQWLKDAQGLPGAGGGQQRTENGRYSDLAALSTIVTVSPSPLAT